MVCIAYIIMLSTYSSSGRIGTGGKLEAKFGEEWHFKNKNYMWLKSISSKMPQLSKMFIVNVFSVYLLSLQTGVFKESL